MSRKLLRLAPRTFACSILVAPLALAESDGLGARTHLSPVAVATPVSGVAESDVANIVEMALLSATVSEKGVKTTVGFTPGDLGDSKYTAVISDTRLTITAETGSGRTKGLLTLPLYDPFNLRGPRALSLHKKQVEEKQCGNLALENDLDLARKLRRCNAEVIDGQWRGLYSWVPKLSITAGVSMLPFGYVPNEDNPQENLPTKPWGGVSGQMDLSFLPAEYLQVDLWGRFRRERGSGKPGTKLASYAEAGATVGVRVVSFLSAGELVEFKYYQQTRFIPGVVVGVSAQQSSCFDDSDCEEGRTSKTSFTPFVDFKFVPALQFRLAVPVETYRAVTVGGEEIAPTLSIAGTIGKL